MSPPGLVLDTGALLACAEGRDRVGDRLATVADRGECVLVPATCLAGAYRQVTDGGWEPLDVIANLVHAVVAPLAP